MTPWAFAAPRQGPVAFSSPLVRRCRRRRNPYRVRDFVPVDSRRQREKLSSTMKPLNRRQSCRGVFPSRAWLGGPEGPLVR